MNITNAILKSIFSTVAFLIASLTSSAMSQELPLTSHPATDAYDGWRLGTQAWTFNRSTFFEAVDKTASLGLDWIEAYPGQELSAEYPDIQLNHTLSSDLRKKVKNKLSQAGITLANYGVVELQDDDAEWRKVFEFAKDMGVETITAEFPEEAFAMIDGLCEEFKIKIAIHNHQKPAHYWNPDGTSNKFNTAYKDMPRKGHIGFQDHGQPVWFRNMKIKQL